MVVYFQKMLPDSVSNEIKQKYNVTEDGPLLFLFFERVFVFLNANIVDDKFALFVTQIRCRLHTVTFNIFTITQIKDSLPPDKHIIICFTCSTKLTFSHASAYISSETD